VTAKQWAHVTEAHDNMSGHLDKILETLSEPRVVIEGKDGASLALREYEGPNMGKKTAVVVYKDEPDGFMITAFFTSRPDKVEKQGAALWPK
jgi:hypothetical protein